MEETKQTIYDPSSFYAKYRTDLESARSLVLIQSPLLAVRRIESLRDSLGGCIRRGVRVCVFTQELSDVKPDYNTVVARSQTFEDAVTLLRDMGLHVTVRDGIRGENFTAIDGTVLWEGSLNPLGHFDSSERMTRWVSRAKVHEVMMLHKLNACDACSSLQPFVFQKTSGALERDSTDWQQIVLIGKLIASKRCEWEISQKELAERAGLQQSIISEIEHGKRNVKVATLLRVCSQLGLELIATPWHIAPAVKQMLDFTPFEPEDDVTSAVLPNPPVVNPR